MTDDKKTDKTESCCTTSKEKKTCCCCESAGHEVKYAARTMTIIAVVAVIALLVYEGEQKLLPQSDTAPVTEAVAPPSSPLPSAAAEIPAPAQAAAPVLSEPQADKRPTFEKVAKSFIRKDGQAVPLSLEMAVTPEQQAYGLMFKADLAPSEGMIFTYDTPQPVYFWMKNTILSLDLIFVGEDGAVSKIVKAAPAGDLTRIPSDKPVRAVVELKAGEADRLGLTVGDTLQ